MISNSISWSTWMTVHSPKRSFSKGGGIAFRKKRTREMGLHFASQSEISVVLRRESSMSSARGSGSFLWCSHHSRTWRRAGTCRRAQEETMSSVSEGVCARARGTERGLHLFEDLGRHVREGDRVVRLSDV